MGLLDRSLSLPASGTDLPLPIHIPSVSSVKTKLPVSSYLNFLTDIDYSPYLVSSWDLLHPREGQEGVADHDTQAQLEKEERGIVFLDSGGYESYWMRDSDWSRAQFHNVADKVSAPYAFSYDADRLEPGKANASQIVRGVGTDQEAVTSTIIPIVHGAPNELPDLCSDVAYSLHPVMLAVPERELGERIRDRARTVRRIRMRLDETGVYYPLHLLGTGDPWSIIVYTALGADSFDGLDWLRVSLRSGNNGIAPFQMSDLVHAIDERLQKLTFVQRTLLLNIRAIDAVIRELRTARRNGVQVGSDLNNRLPSRLRNFVKSNSPYL